MFGRLRWIALLIVVSACSDRCDNGGSDPRVTIEGPADDRVNDHLPDIELAVELEDYVSVGDVEWVSIRNVILVFEDTTTVGEAQALLGSVDATIIGGNPAAGCLFLQLPTSSVDELFPIVETLAADPGVRFALPDMGGAPTAAPPNSYTAGLWDWSALNGNWGLAFVRAPQLWNLDTAVRRAALPPVAVGVVEAGAPGADPSGHPDLPPIDRVAGGIADHGAMVIGVIGARWDNNLGVEGIDPWLHHVTSASLTVVNAHANTLHSFGKELDLLVRMIGADPSIRALNGSYARIDFGCDPLTTEFGDYNCDGDHDDTVMYDTDHDGVPEPIGELRSLDLDHDGVPETDARVMDYFGDLFHAVLTLERRGDAPLLQGAFLVAGAGNTARLTRYSGPTQNAAIRFGGSFLAVGGVDRMGTLVFGGADTQTMAPGLCVRTTEMVDAQQGDSCVRGDASPEYAVGSGSSFAAPVVTGLIAALYSIRHDLTRDEVRTLLTDPRFTRPTTPMVVDAFRAAMGIDLLREQKILRRALTDVDDGTEDGNLRVDEAGVATTTIETDDGRRGDGHHDMSDFRAYRDAVLVWKEARGVIPPGVISLDGLPTHFKKDLNVDGCAGGLAVAPAWPAPHGPGPGPDCAHAPEESAHSRFDWNGDGSVEPEAVSRLNGEYLRDIDLLFDPELWEIGTERVVIDPTFEGAVPGTLTDWSPMYYLLADRDGDLVEDYLHSADLHLVIEPLPNGIDSLYVSVQSGGPAGDFASSTCGHVDTALAWRRCKEFTSRMRVVETVTIPIWSGYVYVGHTASGPSSSLDGFNDWYNAFEIPDMKPGQDCWLFIPSHTLRCG